MDPVCYRSVSSRCKPLSCPKDSVHHAPSHRLPLSFFMFQTLLYLLSIGVLFRPKLSVVTYSHQLSLHQQLHVIHCKQKLSWSKLKAALIYGYTYKYLVDNLAVCLLYKITVVPSSLRVYDLPTHMLLTRIPVPDMKSLLWSSPQILNQKAAVYLRNRQATVASVGTFCLIFYFIYLFIYFYIETWHCLGCPWTYLINLAGIELAIFLS